MNTLQTIQQKLKSPKGQYNSFGKYHYRNCEDILEAVKPLLAETNSTLILDDDLTVVGPMVFVQSTATLTNEEGKTWTASAYARHAEEQKGMAEAQITGSASSYARKYALNGLFLIDDTKDADTTNDGTKVAATKPAQKPAPKPKNLEELTPAHKSWGYVVERVKGGVPIETIKQSFSLSESTIQLLNETK